MPAQTLGALLRMHWGGKALSAFLDITLKG